MQPRSTISCGLSPKLRSCSALLCRQKAKLQLTNAVHRFERVSILQRTGFINREELHTVDTSAIASDSKNATPGFFKIGRWVWAHDPGRYARDNYDAYLAHLEKGAPFRNTNLPPGHVYEPWSLESETERMKAGRKSTLKQNGDWSA